LRSLAPPLPAPTCAGPHARLSRGLTLVELMVGLAVLAVVLAVAAPQFPQWGRSTRVMTQTFDLQNSLAFARSEAMRRGVRVTVCRTDSPRAGTPSCNASAAWAAGWLVFVDNTQVAGNVAGVIDGADSVLRIGDTANGSAITTAGNLGAWISYGSTGLTRTDGGPANGSFLVCQSPHGRRVNVTPVGMVTMATEAC
jgi:type IV fimbrial biogenesis protein FimT